MRDKDHWVDERIKGICVKEMNDKGGKRDERTRGMRLPEVGGEGYRAG